MNRALLIATHVVQTIQAEHWAKPGRVLRTEDREVLACLFDRAQQYAEEMADSSREALLATLVVQLQREVMKLRPSRERLSLERQGL